MSIKMSSIQQSHEHAFVIDLLTTLRNDRFSLRAWKSFLQRSWLMSWQTANTNLPLKRSWQRVTCLVALLTMIIITGNYLLMGSTDTLHLLPGLIFCVVWQQSDLFWHLGLNRSLQSGELLPDIGVANTLTWLRGLCASYLLARLAGGLGVSSELALVVFLGGRATDILDGLIARRTATQSKLGQIADAETDFCLYLSLTIILLKNGVLPLWIGLVMLLRFVIPLLAALLSYFVFAHPVRFGSTSLGKYAGLAQCLYFLVLLTPAPLATGAHILAVPLLSIMICLL